MTPRRGASTRCPLPSPHCVSSTAAAACSPMSLAGRSRCRACRRGCSPRGGAGSGARRFGSMATCGAAARATTAETRSTCTPTPGPGLSCGTGSGGTAMAGGTRCRCSLQPPASSLQPLPPACSPCLQPAVPVSDPHLHANHGWWDALAVGQERGTCERARRVWRRLSPRGGAHARRRGLGLPAGTGLRRLRRGKPAPCKRPATLRDRGGAAAPCVRRLQPCVCRL